MSNNKLNNSKSINNIMNNSIRKYIIISISKSIVISLILV